MAELITEGEVTFDVEGVFYNPRMKMNRDISIAVCRTLKISDYLDGLAASGARGLRISKEANVEKVTMNDVSPVACERIIQNIERNNLTGCEAVCCNANALMQERRFQAVDLDPFGSPSPFISAGARCALSYLFITATDTAPLCGAHLKSGIRKYMALPLKTDYHREMGARILLGLAARELARLDKAMVPLLTHATEHYVRTYLVAKHGAKAADKCLENLGYIEHCWSCGSFVSVEMPCAKGCKTCGGKTEIAGPLWRGKIQDADFIGSAINNLGDGNPLAKKLLEVCANEIDAPMYYDHHKICKRLGAAPEKVDLVVERLRESGWKASRTHFTGVGIKTDANVKDIEELLKQPI
jgi:tRNA (guanine26-N2/guanine27-N2)-dimethyltransferase